MAGLLHGRYTSKLSGRPPSGSPPSEREHWSRLTISATAVFLLSPTLRGFDQTVTAALNDECHHLGRKPIRLRPLPKLTAGRLPRAFAAGNSRARFAAWISSRCPNSATPASTVAIIRPCGDERSNVIPFMAITDDLARFEFFQRCEQVRWCCAPSARSSVHQHRVNLLLRAAWARAHDLAPFQPGPVSRPSRFP